LPLLVVSVIMDKLSRVLSNGKYRFQPKAYESYRSCTNAEDAPKELQVFALDCEMVRTTKRNEVARVSLVDQDEKVILDMLVKPKNKILDYHTKYSGITKEQLKDIRTTPDEARNTVLNILSPSDFLIGHDIQNDLCALRISHSNCIDTSKIFPHRNGCTNSPSLKYLASNYLKKHIQAGTGGHDSTEDALTCIQLLKWREKFDEKVQNGWYSDQTEAKEAIKFAVRVQGLQQFSDERKFRKLLKDLKIKLAWENQLFMWFSEEIMSSTNEQKTWNLAPVPRESTSSKSSRIRFSNMEEAQCAIRAYKGGRPKSEAKFKNWCRSSLNIDESLHAQLWTWFSQDYPRENSDNAINTPSNQFATIDEVKLAIIAQCEKGVPKSKGKFTNFLGNSLVKKVPSRFHNELWHWAKQRYSI